jgi:hypothetical protein
MKKTSKKSKVSKVSKFHLLMYVEGCTPKIKKFISIKALNDFVLEFEAEYGREEFGDNWIDYAVTDVTGKVLPYSHDVAVE